MCVLWFFGIKLPTFSSWTSSFFRAYRSHLQMVPSSQTQMRTFPSLLMLVCRIAAEHLGCWSTVNLASLGSSTSKSQM